MTTVFVCGPELRGEALAGLTVRDGAVVWEDAAEAAPQPVEPILARHRVPIGEGLVILLTAEGVYVVSADGGAGELPEAPVWAARY